VPVAIALLALTDNPLFYPQAMAIPLFALAMTSRTDARSD
jgi:hypothetical protein